MTRRRTGVVTALVLVLGLVTACTSGRSDDDVAELAALDDPAAALAWLTDGDDASLEGRDVSGRLLGLVGDGWPDHGDAAAEVLSSALAEAPDTEDRARLTAQLIHVVANDDIEEDAVREAVAVVLAAHAADVRRIASDVGLSIDDQWTIVVGDRAVPSVGPSTLGDALGKLEDDGLVVLTALAHDRRREIVEAAQSAGEPRTVETLTASEAADVVTDGKAFGATVDLVLSRSFTEQDDRLLALATAVDVAFTVPADAPVSALAHATQDRGALPVSDASTALELLTINGLLEAGFLDSSVDPTYGLPDGTIIDGRLDPRLVDGEAGKEPSADVVAGFNGWLIGQGPSAAPYSLIGEEATGAAEIGAQ